MITYHVPHLTWIAKISIMIINEANHCPNVPVGSDPIGTLRPHWHSLLSLMYVGVVSDRQRSCNIFKLKGVGSFQCMWYKVTHFHGVSECANPRSQIARHLDEALTHQWLVTIIVNGVWKYFCRLRTSTLPPYYSDLAHIAKISALQQAPQSHQVAGLVRSSRHFSQCHHVETLGEWLSLNSDRKTVLANRKITTVRSFTTVVHHRQMFANKLNPCEMEHFFFLNTWLT